MISRQTAYEGRPGAIGALEEAWGWLFTHGLIVNSGLHSSWSIRITRRGEKLLDEGIAWLRATDRLDVELLPVLELKARPHFLRGDYESAIFHAMKEVEIAVRAKALLTDSDTGVSLMAKAFNDQGSLWDCSVASGEAKGVMYLFMGAMALFRNPTGHRRVDLKDASEAAETVLYADLLLRILNRLPTPSRASAT